MQSSLAPSFIAASVYQAFGRLVWTVTPLDKINFRTLWVFPRLITPFFVLFDLLAFLIQVWGVLVVSAAYTKADNDPEKVDVDDVKTGSNILKIGLIVQLVCFGFFALIGIKFVITSRNWASPIDRRGKVLGTWRRLSWAINIAATLIMARAIYRIFEFANPLDVNSVYNKEWGYWVFDTIPIFFACLVFLIWHPGYYIPRANAKFFLNKKKLRQRRDAEENNEKFGSINATLAQDPVIYQQPLRQSYTTGPMPGVGLGINSAGMNSVSRSPPSRTPSGSRRGPRPNLQVNTTMRPHLGMAVNGSQSRFPVNPRPAAGPAVGAHDPYGGGRYNGGDLGSYPSTNPRVFV